MEIVYATPQESRKKFLQLTGLAFFLIYAALISLFFIWVIDVSG